MEAPSQLDSPCHHSARNRKPGTLTPTLGPNHDNRGSVQPKQIATPHSWRA